MATSDYPDFRLMLDRWELLSARINPDVLDIINLNSGGDVEYYWASAHWFSICAALEWHGEVIPDDWEYSNPRSPQRLEDFPDSMYGELLEFGTVSGSDLRIAGEMLGAYMQWLKSNGHDPDE